MVVNVGVKNDFTGLKLLFCQVIIEIQALLLCLYQCLESICKIMVSAGKETVAINDHPFMVSHGRWQGIAQDTGPRTHLAGNNRNTCHKSLIGTMHMAFAPAFAIAFIADHRQYYGKFGVSVQNGAAIRKFINALVRLEFA